MTAVPDQAARTTALEPARSFIVQAPAGSGKTELLTQRLLRLLAGVREPEEVLAITFTRKAAAEMRNRIVDALHSAPGEEPKQAHERTRWKLARRVLEQDRARSWNLLENPGRLNLRTIDSFCHSLAGSLPLLTSFGGKPEVTDDAQQLYREAASHTIDTLESDDSQFAEPAAILLAHLGNNRPKLEQLIVEMLQRRDQWLGPLLQQYDAGRREAQELALCRIVETELRSVDQLWDPRLHARASDLAGFAADNIGHRDDSALTWFADNRAFPRPRVADLDGWQELGKMLLTTAGKWRLQVTKREGFPAVGAGVDAAQKALFKQRKAECLELLGELREQEALRRALCAVVTLPASHYSEAQWVLLEALHALLTHAVSELRLVFATRSVCDHLEVAVAAQQALGDEQMPSDLALVLDHRLSHILVDEFQDTSFGQFNLLKKLTAGWSPGDGRTLFLVGDPMQSIYRFRQAQVRLFLDVWSEGFADLQLTPLSLEVNFRSDQAVVEWVNQTFSRLFPDSPDPLRGAVSYAPAVALKGGSGDHGVTFHPLISADLGSEAGIVSVLVQRTLQQQPGGSLAILVRGRNHLAEIAPHLRAAGVAFQAVEIERLSTSMTIQDLRSLTRALIHRADRVAWLALLRAPWAGLSLADLLCLTADDKRTVPAILGDTVCRARLSPEGQARVARVWSVLEEALVQRRRRSLSATVEACWLRLGGAPESEEVALFLALLAAQEEGGDLSNLALLDEALEKLFVPVDRDASAQVQLMTIHKSKGLEFDTVILPGLGRRTQTNRTPLLRVEEPPGENSGVVFGPVPGVSESAVPLVDYLNTLERQRDDHETRRLLYVAATRAKTRLQLIGHATIRGSDAQPKPTSGSMLAHLWPVVEHQFDELTEGEPDEIKVRVVNAPLSSLSPDWSMAPLPGPVVAPPVTLQAAAGVEMPEFSWAGESARQVGTLVHRILEQIAGNPPEDWPVERIITMRETFARVLANMGLPDAALPSAVERVIQALQNSLTDQRGRWILFGDHAHAESELALTAVIDGSPGNHVIDRTFVDTDGTRWIVDYKTSSHRGGNLHGFLDSEVERYNPQLQRYAEVIRLTWDGTIMLGLYFPLLPAWRAWPP